MQDERREKRDDEDPDRDSSEVVTGPIGTAHLVDPARAEGLGADLDKLPGVDLGEPDTGSPGAAGSPGR